MHRAREHSHARARRARTHTAHTNAHGTHVGLVRSEFAATAARLREALSAMAAAAVYVPENSQAMEDVPAVDGAGAGGAKADRAAAPAPSPAPAPDSGAELRGAIEGARIVVRRPLEAVCEGGGGALPGGGG